MKTGDNSIKPPILYLSYDGLTDPLGRSQILPYLQGLSLEYSVTVITFEKRAAFNQFSASTYGLCQACGLKWRPLKYHRSPPVVSTLYDLFLLYRAVRKLFSKNNIQVVHCRSYLTSLVGIWLKHEFQAKFIFDMRGFWADERVDGGLWNLRNPLYKLIYDFFKNKERRFITEADHIVSLTESARSQIYSWRLTAAPISVIPTCVDMSFFDPARFRNESRRLRTTLGVSENDFVLVYLGSWGTWYRTNEMLDFFSVLAAIIPDARLLILSMDRPEISDHPLSSRIIIRKVSREDVPAYLGVANASICFIKPTFSKKASSATKIAEAWAMNLPVVTNPAWGDIDKLHDSGFPLLICTSPADYEPVALKLASLKVNRNYRQSLIGQFDLKSGIEKYKGIYQSLGIV